MESKEIKKSLTSERHGSDKIDGYGTCLDCGKQIDIEKLDTKNV
jgi:RNA polymerase-binding transcription factor DksA